jgi:hypothetical protein
VANTLVYFTILFGCCLYTVLRGSPPERIGAAILTLGSILTLVMLSSAATIYRSLEVGVFVVDVATLLAFLVLALRADRLWPLCITALQLVGTAGHAVKLVDPQVLPYAYAFALRFWSYPMMLMLLIGTWNHQRRLAKYGVDRSWSSFSGPSAPPPPAGPTV